jgi:hypothetical protein
VEEFTPGSLGFSEVWLVGGPLDGIAYSDMPKFPDGKPATSVAVPLTDGAQAGLFASYTRRVSVALDGRWYYDFVALSTDPTPIEPVPFPTGTSVSNSVGMNESVEQDTKPDPGIGSTENFYPAPRFVLAQAWWIASELCRRNSRLRILDAWPLDGFYHGLEVGEKLNEDHVFLNFLGGIHYFPKLSHLGGPSWGRVLGAESPHEIVKEIETAMLWGKTGADATTPRSLVYRTIAAVLSAKIEDRERWDVAAAYTIGGFVDWPELLDEYQGCRLALQKDTIAELPPSTRVWMLQRGGQSVSLISELGLAFSKNADPVDLMATYKRNHRLDDVLSFVVPPVP